MVDPSAITLSVHCSSGWQKGGPLAATISDIAHGEQGTGRPGGQMRLWYILLEERTPSTESPAAVTLEAIIPAPWSPVPQGSIRIGLNHEGLLALPALLLLEQLLLLFQLLQPHTREFILQGLFLPRFIFLRRSLLAEQPRCLPPRPAGPLSFS